MEQLTPVQNEADEAFAIPQDVSSQMDLKNLQFLNYLGLKDEMFNGKIMDKVKFLTDNLSLNELINLDFKVGQDPNMPRIDRIYSFLKLDLISRQKRDELELIDNAKNKWLGEQQQ